MQDNPPLMRAAFVTQHESWPWRRQLPEGRPNVEGVEFFAPIENADVVFVYDALPCKFLKVASSALTVHISSEPENVKRYNPAFLAQFDLMITTDRQNYHPNRIFTHAGLPWWAGSMSNGGVLLDTPMTFQDFEMHDPVKTRLVSVVSSDKAFTPEHRTRLDFVAKLKQALGDQVDVFGRGIVDFADKRDVLDTYRYHIALENCAIPDYWTEKLADPFLTLTFPIYHGCPNILDYFPEGALRRIDIHAPDEAIAIIREVIASDLAERNRDQLLEARRRVLHEHNLFHLLARVAYAHAGIGKPRAKGSRRTLRAETEFVPLAQRVKAIAYRFVGDRPKLRHAIRAMRARLAIGERKLRH